jgi:hypothetical protein
MLQKVCVKYNFLADTAENTRSQKNGSRIIISPGKGKDGSKGNCSISVWYSTFLA